MRRGSSAAGVLAAILLLAADPSHVVAQSRAAQRAGAARANSPNPSEPPREAAPTAPAGPALKTGASRGELDEQAGSASPAGEADPLVSNGLGSPACSSPSAELALGATERRDCETSGFVAAAAPTGDYGIDVHIDTGVLGLSSGGLLSVVQDVVVAPVWMALVWIVHALVVMLEWSFALNLLEGGGVASIRADLLSTEAGLTAPWLPLALAMAALVLAYRGLVLRRVADSLGEVTAMSLMILGGLWVMLDPGGTVGTLSRWAQQAGVGTLAVAAHGSPAAPERSLGESMAGLFGASIEGPWCYLEFGDVRWCEQTGRLDARLRDAGLQIATAELGEAGCRGTTGVCSGESGSSARSLQSSARLLREARTNGAVFLALPANGPARNSINDSWSLLRSLCQSEEATHCRGSTAAQAQFRTNGGTWSRVGGLLLIGAGLLGLVLLIGLLAIRLLVAAVLSVLYLLLAPGIVLAPAFGERGRDLFRAWAGSLCGALAAKVIYAFLLGAVLAVVAVLQALPGLGWWMRWLLVSAFWWSAFFNRHQLRTVTAAGGPISPFPRRGRGLAPASRVRARLSEHHDRTRGKHGPPVTPPAAPSERQPPTVAAPGSVAGSEATEAATARRPMPVARREAILALGPEQPDNASPASHARTRHGVAAVAREADTTGDRGGASDPDVRAGQIGRIDEALARARSDGDTRREALLEVRRERIAREVGTAASDGPAPARPASARPGSDSRPGSEHGDGLAQRVAVDGDLAARRASSPGSPAPLGVEEGTVSDVWADIRAVTEGRKRQFGIGKP